MVSAILKQQIVLGFKKLLCFGLEGIISVALKNKINNSYEDNTEIAIE
jgi:hypothetical protein